MRDLRFIAVSDAIQILDTSEVEGTSARTLKIISTGGMAHANRVYINGLGIDAFTILSRTSLLVTLPSTLDTVDLADMDISVSSSTLTSTKTPSSLSFGTTRSIKSVEGIQKLIQQVVKTLLSNIGSNRFSPYSGGGLIAGMRGVTMDRGASARISSVLQAAVNSTLETITSAQVGQVISADEKLLSLSVNSLNFDSSSTEVSAGITLITYAGTNFTIPLAL
jgi:hypothetical protein